MMCSIVASSHLRIGPPEPNHDTTNNTENASSSTADTCAQNPAGNVCCGAACLALLLLGLRRRAVLERVDERVRVVFLFVAISFLLYSVYAWFDSVYCSIIYYIRQSVRTHLTTSATSQQVSAAVCLRVCACCCRSQYSKQGFDAGSQVRCVSARHGQYIPLAACG